MCCDQLRGTAAVLRPCGRAVPPRLRRMNPILVRTRIAELWCPCICEDISILGRRGDSSVRRRAGSRKSIRRRAAAGNSVRRQAAANDAVRRRAAAGNSVRRQAVNSVRRRPRRTATRCSHDTTRVHDPAPLIRRRRNDSADHLAVRMRTKQARSGRGCGLQLQTNVSRTKSLDAEIALLVRIARRNHDDCLWWSDGVDISLRGTSCVESSGPADPPRDRPPAEDPPAEDPPRTNGKNTSFGSWKMRIKHDVDENEIVEMIMQEQRNDGHLRRSRSYPGFKKALLRSRTWWTTNNQLAPVLLERSKSVFWVSVRHRSESRRTELEVEPRTEDCSLDF